MTLPIASLLLAIPLNAEPPDPASETIARPDSSHAPAPNTLPLTPAAPTGNLPTDPASLPPTDPATSNHRPPPTTDSTQSAPEPAPPVSMLPGSPKEGSMLPATSSYRKPWKALPQWMIRLQAGPGWVTASDGARILGKDGYDMGLRWQGMVDMSCRVASHMGLGAWASLAGNSWSGGFDGGIAGSNVVQQVGYAGMEAPLYLLLEDGSSPTIALTPRFGLAYGRLSLHGGGDWHPTWTAGVEFSLTHRVSAKSPIFIGFALSALWAPTKMGNGLYNYDMGGYFLSFVGGYGE